MRKYWRVIVAVVAFGLAFALLTPASAHWVHPSGSAGRPALEAPHTFP